MSGVAHSLPEQPEPDDLPELDWKCALCGDEEAPLMLGPWWNPKTDHPETVTRCTDWRACRARSEAARVKPVVKPAPEPMKVAAEPAAEGESDARWFD